MPVQFTAVDSAASNLVTGECDCYVHQFGAIGPGRRAARYPSDMADAEWPRSLRRCPFRTGWRVAGGRPEAHCRREMIDAVRYLVDNGVK